MSHIKVSQMVTQPVDVVWQAIADLASHVKWMKDAVSLEFLTDRASGVGTTMEVATRVGPLRTIDVIEVTDWMEGSHIDVKHKGLITGRGRLAVMSAEDRTIVTWTEDLRFPWWTGGPVAAWVAKPVLASLWKGNLRRLEASLSSR